MRALVAVKRVVDYAVKVRIAKDGAGVELGGVKMSMNPFCEIAIEEATRLKKKGLVNDIVAVSCGPPKCQDTLRHALAMGADRAIHVNTDLRPDKDLQPLAVAKILKLLAERENPSIVLMGKQAIDGDYNQCGQMLAGLLNWPQATFASKIIVEGNEFLDVSREVDNGIQTIRVKLPAVITCDLRLNTPKYATLPNIQKAKKKPLDVIDASSLGLDLQPRLKTLSTEPPPKRQPGIMVSSVAELVDKLVNDAKVLVE